MRAVKFYAVGGIGIGVQAATLGLLLHVFGVHYLWATALAVEAAVLHNFVWHWKWTWADRQSSAMAANFFPALWRFHVANGLTSMAGNLLFMRLLVGSAGMEPLVANLISITLCSLVNSLLSDRFVFVLPNARSSRR
ncbi:MAG: GtrA family protein [Acidobacteria bacterium]|nr:GtrA family protein [Acidobacteriota bacterium]